MRSGHSSSPSGQARAKTLRCDRDIGRQLERLARPQVHAIGRSDRELPPRDVDADRRPQHEQDHVALAEDSTGDAPPASKNICI